LIIFLRPAQWSIAFCSVMFPWRNRSNWVAYIRAWSLFGLIAICVEFPQLLPFVMRISQSSFLHFIPIYKKCIVNMEGVPHHWAGFLVMWWRSLGVFGAIALTFGFINLNAERIRLYLPSIAVWIATNFVIYQPWEWTNIKIHLAVWIPFAAPVVRLYFMSLFSRRETVVIGAVLMVAATLCGAWQNARELVRPYQIFTDDAIQVGLWIAENCRRDARFVASNSHAAPPATIGSRQLFMG
jgi:hypothetical protein